MFAADRDLLIYEPNLFRDVVFLGQRVASGIADAAEFTLTFYPDDSTLAAAGVGPGVVVTLNGVAHEVLELTADNEAIISRLRAADDAPPLPPAPVSGAPAFVFSAAPQMRAVYLRILRTIGIEPQGAPVPGQPREQDITNGKALRHLLCMGTLELLFRAAGTLLDEAHPVNQRARFYAAAFEAERDRAVAHLDANGDGVPDTIRRLNGTPLARG